MSIHFLTLQVQTHSEQFAKWFDGMYFSHDLGPLFPHKRETFHLWVEEMDSGHCFDIEPLDTDYDTHIEIGGPSYYHNGRFYSKSEGEFRHELDFCFETHTLRTNLGGEYAHNESYFIRMILAIFSRSIFLPFYQLKPLHAAAMHKAGKVLLLGGDGGMGKTTTALKLLDAGYSILSDDGPLFTYDNGKIWVMASLDCIRISDTTLRMMPELKRYIRGGQDFADKHAVKFALLEPEKQALGPYSVTHYIRLNRHERFSDGPRLVKIDKYSLMEELLNDHLLVFRLPIFQSESQRFADHSNFVFTLISQLVHEADLYELQFADSHLEAIGPLLDSLVYS